MTCTHRPGPFKVAGIHLQQTTRSIDSEGGETAKKLHNLEYT